jgi:hypothetical protein
MARPGQGKLTRFLISMIGDTSNPGVIPRILTKLFNSVEEESGQTDIQKPKTTHTVKMSYLEVYNENIIDLLSFENRSLIEIREDPVRGILLHGLSEVTIESTSEILRQMNLGNARRTKEPTQANEVSSRSHAVLQLSIEKKIFEKNSKSLLETFTFSKLSLIDLAGSERAAYTQNTGLRMLEGANINKSLLALGNCINTLAELSSKKKGAKRSFVSYRDSKLTRLLKDSLDGNCKTLMIANVSPAFACYEDTLNTLKYANRAKSISTKPFLVSNSAFDLLSGDGETEKLKEYIRSFRTADLNHIIGSLSQEVDILSSELSKVTDGKGGAGSDNAELTKLQTEIIAHFDSESTILQQISSQKRLHSKDEVVSELVANYMEIYKKRAFFVKRIVSFVETSFVRKYLESVYDLHKEKAELSDSFDHIKRHVPFEHSHNRSSSKKDTGQMIPLSNISVFQTRRIANDSITDKQFPTLKKQYSRNLLKENIERVNFPNTRNSKYYGDSSIPQKSRNEVGNSAKLKDLRAVRRTDESVNIKSKIKTTGNLVTEPPERSYSDARISNIRPVNKKGSNQSLQNQPSATLGKNQKSSSRPPVLEKIQTAQKAALKLLKSKYNLN